MKIAMNTRCFLLAMLFALGMTSLVAAESGGAGGIHFIVGPSSHPPGTHEVAAGARLLKYCLERSGIQAMPKTHLHEGWPESPGALSGARAIVFCGDQFPPARFKNTGAILEQLSRLADQRCGFVAIHYAIGVNRPAADEAGTTPPALTRLTDGRLALTYGYRKPIAGPTSIRAKISEDDGATWGGELILRSGGGDEDIGYTRNRPAARRQDRHALLLAGKREGRA